MVENKGVKRLEAPARLRVAEEIPVCAFREILLWPFVLAGRDGAAEDKENLAGRMCEIASEAAEEDGWEKVPDLADHVGNDPGESFGGTGRDHPQSWAEIVYFHDFVQRALFRETQGKWPDADAPIWLLRNSRLKGLKTDIKGRQLNFAVDRFNLYLFPTGVAILALEVKLETKDGCPLPRLSDVQNFMDCFRRWHVPFWDNDNASKPGLLPERVSWIWEGTEEPKEFSSGDPDFYQSQKKLLSSKLRTPHPLPHWLEVLPDIIGKNLASALDDDHAASAGAMRGFYWRTISDERMITTNFIIVPKDCYGRIRESDWVRLCFADAAGEGWPYLIHGGDWKAFHKEHVFDWFHKLGTRQLFAGFNHTMVCASGDYPENTLVHHFRRHYFQMALLAQFEFAALLSFSSRITRTVEALRKNGDESRFRDRFIRLRRDFLHFVHEFRFTGVSNQMQARAMYEMWRKHLGLNELFHDVEDELRSGNDYLLAIENREQTETALQQAETAGRLNVIVAVAASLGLVIAFAGTTGMTIIWNKNGSDYWFVIFGILLFLTLVMTYVFAIIILQDKNKHKLTFSLLCRILKILLPFSVAIIILGIIFG